MGFGAIGLFTVATDDLPWDRKPLGLAVFMLLTRASGYLVYRLRLRPGRE